MSIPPTSTPITSSQSSWFPSFRNAFSFSFSKQRLTKQPSDIFQVNTVREPSADVKTLLNIFKIPYQFVVYRRTPGSTRLQGTAEEMTAHLASADTVTIGDLHGSYRKLVENLVAAQLITMPKTVAENFVKDSDELEDWLKADPELNTTVALKNVLKIHDRLLSLIPQFEWNKARKRQLILIGDVLSDRGPFDSLTLAIVEHLTKDRPDRIIRIASNHDHDGMRYYCPDRGGPLITASEYTPSLWRSIKLFKSSPDKREELKKQYNRYLQASRLMHYNPKTGSLYTHAPVSTQNVYNLTKAFIPSGHLPLAWVWPGALEKELKKLNKDTLPDFIQKINGGYQDYIQQCFSKKFKQGTSALQYNDLENAIAGFLWERNDQNLFYRTDLPFREQGVNTLIHGHHHYRDDPFNIEKRTDFQPNNYLVVNLDQQVRKGLEWTHPPENKTQNHNLVFVE